MTGIQGSYINSSPLAAKKFDFDNLFIKYEFEMGFNEKKFMPSNINEMSQLSNGFFLANY